MNLADKKEEGIPFGDGLIALNKTYSDGILSQKKYSSNQTKSKEPLKILTPQGSKIVGIVELLDGKRVLFKKVRKSKHLFRALDAWAVQEEILGYIDEIVIEDIEDGIKYFSSVANILSHGIRRDLGYGCQVFLPRKFWNQNNNAQLILEDDISEIK